MEVLTVNLEKMRVNPNPEPPEIIKNVARSYLKDGEEYNIYPQRVILNGDTYYFVTYFYTEKEITGILIVNENGTLPLHKDCLEIYQYVTGVETGLKNVLAYGSSWSQRPMTLWKRLRSHLKPFAKMVNASDDEAFKKGYEVFCSIPRVMFETQDQLKAAVEQAKKYYRELTTDYVVTKEFYERVDKNYLYMMEIKKKQFEVQIETETERTQFMEKLKEVIPLFALRKWYLYLRLKKFHHWLNADPATMAEYKEFKSDISRKKASEPERKKLIEIIRNPRD
jgi:hypothetical protein